MASSSALPLDILEAGGPRWLDEPPLTAGHALLLVDVDNLIRINENYGAEAGDRVVATVGELLLSLADGAEVVRHVGDSFLYVMEAAEPDAALARAEELVRTLGQAEIEVAEGKRLKVGASIGVATVDHDLMPRQELLAHARAALRRCKREGRRRAALADQTPLGLLVGEQFHRLFPTTDWCPLPPTAPENGETLLDEATAHLGQGFLVLAGPTGAGKSRLMAELASRVDLQSFVFPIAACSPLSRTQPLSVFVTLFEEFVAGSQERLEFLTDPLDPEQRQAVAALSRKLARDKGKKRSAGGRVIIDAFITMFATLAEHAPVFVRLDDMQWTDVASLKLLEKLAEHPCASRLTVVLAVNSDVPNPTLDDFFESSADHVHRIEMTSLDVKGMLGFVRTSLPFADPVKTRLGDIARSTGGNPLLFEETLRFLVSRRLLRLNEGALVIEEFPRDLLPVTISEAMSRRLEYLPRETVRMLGRAAAVGTAFDLATLERAEPRPRPILLEALEEAREQRIVRLSGDRWQFLCEDVRRGFYERMEEGERMGAHKEIGDYQEEMLDEEGDQAMSSAAWHLDRAGEIERSLALVHQMMNTYAELLAPRKGMEVVVSKIPDAKDWQAPPLTPALRVSAEQVLRQLRTCAKSFESYSEESPLRSLALGSFYSALAKQLDAAQVLSIDVLPNETVINGESGGAIEGLEAFLARHELSGLLFRDGITMKETELFVHLLGGRKETITSGGGWSAVLREKGIVHAQVNERIYVGVTERDLLDKQRLKDANVSLKTNQPAQQPAAVSAAPPPPPPSVPMAPATPQYSDPALQGISKALEGFDGAGADPLARLAEIKDMLEELQRRHGGPTRPPDPEGMPNYVPISGAKGLVLSGTLPSIPALLEIVASGSPQDARDAVARIWEQKDQAVQHLVSFLASSESPAARDLVFDLLRQCAPRYESLLMDRLMASTSPDDSMRLMRAMIDGKCKWSGSTSISLLHHQLGEVRRGTAQILMGSHLTDTDKLSLLAEAATSENANAAGDAVRAIGSLQTPDAVGYLTAALKKTRKQDAETLHREVCLALGATRSKEAIQPLVEILSPSFLAALFLGRRPSSVRAAAAFGLGHIDDPRVDEVLAKCVADPDGEVRAAVRLAIDYRKDVKSNPARAQGLLDVTALERAMKKGGEEPS